MKKHLKPLLQKAASKLGTTLVSTSHYDALQTQRATLLIEAANLYRAKLNKNDAVGIVFSFNRPVQLHALLASYFHYVKNPVRLIVQYRAPSPLAASIYKEVEAEFKNYPVAFVEETTCRATLLEILAGLPERKMFFLVDDDIFIRPFDMAQFASINPLEFVPSMRMGPHLNYSYTMKMPQPAPKLSPSPKHKGMLTWAWGAAGNEWAYPYSVEGHLFDTAEILMMTRSMPFKAPNTYEGMLAGYANIAAHRPGLCYQHSVLLNIPANKVQTENTNHAGESHAVSPEEFLARWQAGEQISPTSFGNLTPTMPHQEEPFLFIKREARAGKGTAAKKAAPVKKATSSKQKKRAA